MKHIRTYLTIGALLIATACAGIRARENVLMPAMAQAFATVIRPNAEAAAEPPAVELDRAREILDSGDRTLAPELLGLWTESILPAFVEGINARFEAGEIGPGVARSLMETTRQFELNLMRLASR